MGALRTPPTPKTKSTPRPKAETWLQKHRSNLLILPSRHWSFPSVSWTSCSKEDASVMNLGLKATLKVLANTFCYISNCMNWALCFLIPAPSPDHTVVSRKKTKKPTSATADVLGRPSACHRFTCHRLLQFQLQDNQHNKWSVTR